MKKLQIALDVFSTDEAVSVLKLAGPYVDIIELGTPLMISEGTRVVRTIKDLYPDKIVFADIKVMDGGAIVSQLAFDAGADMVSVLAAAEDNTILATLECARKNNRKVLVDFCAVPDIQARGKHIEPWNPDYLCVHVGYDIQKTGVDPVEELNKLKGIKIPKAIAGGIKLSTFQQAVESDADVIIVGSGLYGQEDIKGTAEKMRAMLDAPRLNRVRLSNSAAFLSGRS